MNFSEIINDENVSSQLKLYNRYIVEHNDEIEFVREDIQNELTKLYGNSISSENGTLITVNLNKKFNNSDEDLIIQIINNAIKQHTPSMPDFLKTHFFTIYNINNTVFIKTK